MNQSPSERSPVNHSPLACSLPPTCVCRSIARAVSSSRSSTISSTTCRAGPGQRHRDGLLNQASLYGLLHPQHIWYSVHHLALGLLLHSHRKVSHRYAATPVAAAWVGVAVRQYASAVQLLPCCPVAVAATADDDSTTFLALQPAATSVATAGAADAHKTQRASAAETSTHGNGLLPALRASVAASHLLIQVLKLSAGQLELCYLWQ